jgi:hypothetical protein
MSDVDAKEYADAKLSLIATTNRDLYVGHVTHLDRNNKVADVKFCRHLAYWVCDVPGGLTSLCAVGPAPGTRCAAPAPGSTLTCIAGVHEMTPEAQEKFRKLDPHGG